MKNKDTRWYEVECITKEGLTSSQTFTDYMDAQNAFDNANEPETYLIQHTFTIIKNKKSN